MQAFVVRTTARLFVFFLPRHKIDAHHLILCVKRQMYTGDEQLNTQLNLSTLKLTRSSMLTLWCHKIHTKEKKTRNKGTHYIFRRFLWFICNMCNTVRYYWLIKEINKPEADRLISSHFKLRSKIQTTQCFPKVWFILPMRKQTKQTCFHYFWLNQNQKRAAKTVMVTVYSSVDYFCLEELRNENIFPLITRTNYWLSKHLEIHLTVDN